MKLANSATQFQVPIPKLPILVAIRKSFSLVVAANTKGKAGNRLKKKKTYTNTGRSDKNVALKNL